MIPGVCEACVLPFHYQNEEVEFDVKNETSYDCVHVTDWNGRNYCPTAVYKDTGLPYGVPYMWACPKLEEHELQPSCFESPDNGW